MFIIDFRNKNMSEYRFSVINNSNVDVVNLYSNFVQYATNTSIYLKIRSVDDTYVDKIAIASENISIDDGALLCKWRMGAVSTHCKKIGLQLQFEQEGDIIAQTGIVYLTLADTIDVDELIPIIYPQILKELQEQIDALTNDSGAKVTLGYSNDVFTINLLNVNNEVIDTKTIAIPTNKAFVNVAFANRVITFTANDGTTKQVDLSDIYTKTEVDNLLANKVDKVSQANKVYATDGNGDQTALPVDNSEGKDGNITRRKMTSGQLSVPTTPVADDDATAKQYVDKFGKTIELSVDPQTYVLTATLKDAKGNVLATQQVDLPLESVVVNGSYDAQTQSIILTLQNGSTITVPVAGLISGLVSQTDFNALALRVTTAENNIITLGNTKVSYSDINVTGGFIISITKNGSTYPVAEAVNVSATPKTVQSTSDLPVDNDGNLYVVLDNGYLYAWSNGWQQLYKYSSDLLTITEIYVGEVIYSYVSDKGHSNRPIQVESAIRDSDGNIINETYAKRNGYYPTLTAGLSDNLTPYSEDSGASQDNPFISNGTGTNNNTEIVTVGDYGLLKEKQGNSIVVNQQFQNPHFSSNSNWATFSNATLSVSSGIAKVECSTDGNISLYPQVAINTIANHKYLVHTRIRTSGKPVLISTPYSQTEPSTTSTSFVDLYMIGSRTSDFSGVYPQLRISNAEVGEYFETSCFELVDLTQWFNGDIPQDLLDHPEHFSWYYNGSLDYNAGTLVNGNGVKLVSTGRNLWDEQAITFGSGIRTGLIKCILNKSYYVRTQSTQSTQIYFQDKSGENISNITISTNQTFNVPNNAVTMFLTFPNYGGTTYNHDITISLYYSPEQGGEGYDKYYAYEEPHITNTGTEVLRSAGSVKDIKKPDGTIIRKVGVVDLGTLSWNYNSDRKLFYTGQLPNSVTISSNMDTFNGLCAKYQATSMNNARYDITPSSDKVMCCGYVTNISQLTIRDDSFNGDTSAFATAMSGVMLYYELETPTTEQGTAFPENLPINDYGMLYWLDSSDNLVGVPQGCKIFYPVNYKGFIDDVHARTDGDASKLVLQTELSASETERDTVDSQLQNAIGGTLRQLLASSKSIDFLNTTFVDLGTLTWTYDNVNDRMISSGPISDLKPTASGQETPNFYCSMYKTTNLDTLVNTNMSIATYTNSYIYIKDTAYTDATAFKNAMKGVLLAYEKA